jgi:hypothetical protein
VEHALRNRAYRAFAGFLCCTALTVGCRKVETRFDIVSFLDAGRPERFSERFDHGSFAVNGIGNYEITFRLPPSLIEVPSQPPPAESAAPEPADDAPPLQPTEEVWMSQIMHVKVIWLPVPGTTHVEKSQTNATLCYCLLTGDDVISYEGAGFVYFRTSRDGKTIEGRIESSSLFPARWTGEPADLFGPCHLTGTFKATECRRDVAAVERKIRRLLGAPMKPDAHKTGKPQGPAD